VFLDDKTASKIVFCKQEDIPAKLNIDKSNIPTFLGGNCSYTFKAEDAQSWGSVAKGPMSHHPQEDIENAWELR